MKGTPPVECDRCGELYYESDGHKCDIVDFYKHKLITCRDMEMFGVPTKDLKELLERCN